MVGGLQTGKSHAGAGGGLLIQLSTLLGGSFWEQSCFSPSLGSHRWGVWGCSSTHLGSPIWEIRGCFATDLRSPLFGGCGALYPPIQSPHILGVLSLGSPRPYSRGFHLTAFFQFSPGTTILLLFRPKQAALQLPTLQAVGKWGHLCHRHHEAPLSPPPSATTGVPGGTSLLGGPFPAQPPYSECPPGSHLPLDMGVTSGVQLLKSTKIPHSWP